MADMRLVQRVRQGYNSEGWSDLVVISEYFQLRRSGSDKWESLDIVIENIDDKQETPPLGRSNRNR